MVDGKKKKVPTAYFLTLREKPKEVQREKGVVVFDHAKINVPVIVNISEVDIPAGGIDLMPTVGKPKREISAEQLRRASPEDVGQIVDTQVNRILEEHPGISSFHLYKLIAEALPGRIPETVQAEASLETKLFFNMKTIISATEDLFSDNDDENNEIIQAAVTSAYKVLTHPDTKVPLSIRIYQAAARGAANYIAIRDNIPISWIVPNIKSYKIIRRVFESDFLDGQRILTNDEVDSLTREIAEQTDISQSHLKDYIVYRNSLKNCSTQEDEEIDGGDDVLGTVMYVDLREKIEENLETILPRQRKVLEQRYGLWDGKEWTLEEVGHELGVDRGRVRVIEARALRKLRHPSRTRKVRDYYS